MSNYDQQFKEESVRLALTSPQSIAKTARDLGLKENTLYKQIGKAKDKAPAVTGQGHSQPNLIDELNGMRKENAHLKEEREILKKAAVFFAKEER